MITTDFKTKKRLMTIVHFNRCAMQQGLPNVWTVHNSLGCFQVTLVKMRCPMDTVFDPDGRQPRAKFKGPAIVEVTDGIAVLR